MKRLSLILLAILLFVASRNTAYAQEWVHGGPFGMNAVTMALCPADTNTIYVGTEGRGVYKTTDGGLSWREINNGIEVMEPTSSQGWKGGFARVRVIAVAPSNPDELWMGTDRDEDGDLRKGGLYHSRDAGESWVNENDWMMDGLMGLAPFVESISIDPLNENHVLIGISEDHEPRSGLYRTLNGGESWAQVDFSPEIMDHIWIRIPVIYRPPNNPERIYVSYRAGYSPGLKRSDDNGETWEHLSLPDWPIIDIQSSSVNDDTLWAVGYTYYGNWGIMKSSTGGVTWQFLSDPAARYSGIHVDTDCRIYVHQSANRTFYRSSNQGESWERVLRDLEYTFAINSNCLNSSTIYVVNHEGFFKSSDDAQTVQWLIGEVDNSHIKHTVLHPTDQGVAFTSTGTGIYRTADFGASWESISRSDDGCQVLIDPRNPDIMYSGGHNNGYSVAVSYNGGETWQGAGTGLRGVTRAIAMHPTHSDTLYCTTVDVGRGRFFYSHDGAESWIEVDLGEDNFYTGSHDIVTGGRSPDDVFFVNGPFFASEDAGQTVVRRNYDFRACAYLAASPDAEIMYASWNDSLFVSYDNGFSFESIPSPFDEWGMIIDLLVPSDGNSGVFAATKSGVLHSSDEGQSWTLVDNSIPRNPTSITMSPDGAEFIVGTYANGVYWRSDNVAVDERNEQVVPSHHGIDFSVYPNPGNASFAVQIVTLDSPGLPAYLSVYNILGQEVVRNTLPPGMLNHSSRISLTKDRDLQSGIYFVVVKQGKKQTVKKLHVIR